MRNKKHLMVSPIPNPYYLPAEKEPDQLSFLTNVAYKCLAFEF